MPIEASDVLDFNEVVERTVSKRPVRARSNRFWPSSINSPYSCNRKEALIRVEEIYTDKTPADLGTHRYGDIGNAIHHIIQTDYLGPSGMLFGGWRCVNCKQSLGSFQTYPKVLCRNRLKVTQAADHQIKAAEIVELDVRCSDIQKSKIAAGEAAWEYDEIKVFDPVLNISGRVDGIIVNNDAEWFTLELKTTSPLNFAGLRAEKISAKRFPGISGTILENASVLMNSYGQLPKSFHITQASIYSELLLREARAGNLTLNPSGYRGTFIAYVNRDTLEIKSFLRRNSAVVFQYAATTVRNITDVVQRADKIPADDPIVEIERVNKNREMIFSHLPKTCNSRTDKKAQSCPWQLICFPYKDTSRNRVEHL